MPEPLLFVSRNLPPLTGGMERLAGHAATELARDWSVYVVGPRGCRKQLPPGMYVVEMPGKGLLSFILTALPLALWVAIRHRPRVLLAGNGLGAPIGRMLRWLMGIPYAVLVHGLDLVASHPVYRHVFLPAIRSADAVIANSEHTLKLARSARIESARLSRLNPGVEYPPPEGTDSFRDAVGAGNRTLALSVGRIVKRKGLAPFIGRCLPGLVTRFPDFLLAIAGEAPSHALSGSDDEGAAIEEAVRVSRMEQHVFLCGHLPEDLIWSAYREADVFVFPCLEIPDDVEGFGMVALEAAAAGLPTAGFRAGGLPDAVVNEATGLLVDQGRYDLLAEAIAFILLAGKARYAEQCRAHASGLDWSRYGAALSTILHGIARHPAGADPASP